MGFSRQEYWSGLPFLPPGDLPNPGTEPKSLMSSVLAGRFFTTSATWKALHYLITKPKCNQELAHVSDRPAAIFRLWPVPNGNYSPHRFTHDQNWWDKLQISLVAQTVRHLPTMRETWVRSLGWKDPLKKEMATHSSTLAWKIPWTEEHGRLQSMGSQRVRHDWATSLSLSLFEEH